MILFVYYTHTFNMLHFDIVHNDENDVVMDYYYSEGMLIPEPGPPNTIWNSYKKCNFDFNDYKSFASFLVSELCNKKLETNDSIRKLFSKLVLRDFPIFNINDVDSIMKDRSCSMYDTLWDAYLTMLEQLANSYHFNGDKLFQ